MNREIKFRGKRLANDEWCYGSLLVWANGECTILEKSDSSNAVWKREIDPNTVGQFTGLHDANGKEIYEGDIFQVKAYEPKFEVFFKNGVFEYRQIGIPNRPYPLRRINFDSYVIGNIYDNKELLEETE